jgi:hypothetical protein
MIVQKHVRQKAAALQVYSLGELAPPVIELIPEACSLQKTVVHGDIRRKIHRRADVAAPYDKLIFSKASQILGNIAPFND